MRSGVTLLLDRDGTLIEDLPYNNDVRYLEVVDGVADSLSRIRARGIAIGLVTNQSAVGRGLADEDQVDSFNDELARRVGGFDVILVCPHVEGCQCRKPAPGLVIAALERLSADPRRAVMVGDIGSDVQAAQAAGIKSILIPNRKTLASEVDSAPVVRRSFVAAMAAVCAFFDTGRLA